MKNYSFLLAAFLIFSACEKEPTTTDNSPDLDGDVSTECQPICENPSFGQDPFDLLSIDPMGECLEIKVRYGGGCETHDFCLSQENMVISQDGASFIFLLNHDNHGDLCEALITKTLYFEQFVSPIMAPMKIRIEVHGPNGQVLGFDRWFMEGWSEKNNVPQ